MSQTINLFDLNKALGFLRPAISNRNIPGLDHLFFNEGKISAFNGNTAVIVDFPLETDLRCGVPHSTFIKTMSSLSSQPKFELDKGFLKVSSGRFKAEFPTALITKDTLIFHPPKDAPVAELPVTSNFISGLGRVWLGSRDSKIEESGVNIFASSTASEVDIITYDGISCSRYNLALENTEIPSLVLPYSFCDAIMKTVDTMLQPPSKLWLGENFAVAEFTEQVKIYSSYFAAPPNTHLYSAALKLFNNGPDYVPIPEGFADSLKRFASVVDQSSMVALDCSDNHLVLTASGQTGMLEEELDFEQNVEGHWTFPLFKLISVQSFVNKMKLTDRCIIFKGIDEHFAHAVAIRN